MALSRTSLSSTKDTRVSATIVSIGEELLRLYDSAIALGSLDQADRNRRAVQCCLAHFASKIQRVTRAALTLIINGQGDEAMSLIREQNDFVIALAYYHKHQDQALLFAVSQALLKRNFAREIMTFDEKAAINPERLKQLATLENEANTAYGEFPGLRHPKGKSADSASPVYIDWSEPSAYSMFADLMDGWLREHYKDGGEPIEEGRFKEHRDKMTARAYFFRSTFISQSKHGTAFAIGSTIDVSAEGALSPQDHQIADPNRLAYHFIQNATAQLPLIRDFNAPGALEAELKALEASYVAMQEELGINDEPVPPLPLKRGSHHQ